MSAIGSDRCVVTFDVVDGKPLVQLRLKRKFAVDKVLTPDDAESLAEALKIAASDAREAAEREGK